MRLAAWNDFPNRGEVEIKFENGPNWLKLLARLPYFERFAYPAALRRGLGILWCESLTQYENDDLSMQGWIVHPREKSKEERFTEGSLALLSQGEPKNYRRRIAITRWGRKRASQIFVHKSNGTYSYLKRGTFPPGL